MLSPPPDEVTVDLYDLVCLIDITAPQLPPVAVAELTNRRGIPLVAVVYRGVKPGKGNTRALAGFVGSPDHMGEMAARIHDAIERLDDPLALMAFEDRYQALLAQLRTRRGRELS